MVLLVSEPGTNRFGSGSVEEQTLWLGVPDPLEVHSRPRKRVPLSFEVIIVLEVTLRQCILRGRDPSSCTEDF